MNELEGDLAIVQTPGVHLVCQRECGIRQALEDKFRKGDADDFVSVGVDVQNIEAVAY